MRRLLLAIGVAAILAGLALAWLLGSAAGARWVAARATAALPGLTISAVDGSLAGTLRLTGVRWTDSGTTVDVQRVEGRIALPPLLGGRIVLQDLRAEDLAVALAPAAGGASPRSDDAAIALPDLTIDALRVDRASVVTDQRTLALDRVAGRLRMGGTTMVFAGLDLAGPEARADGELTLDFARTLPLASANLRFDLALDGTRFAGSAGLSPTNDAVAIALALVSPVQATLDGTAAPDWSRASLALRAPRQDGATIGIDGALAVDLRAGFADGAWQPRGSLALDGDTLAIEDGLLRDDGSAAIEIAGLRLASPRHGTLTVEGRAPRDATGRWALRLATDGLRWPREDAEPLRIDGTATVDGPARAPTLRPDLRLEVAGLPEARVAGALAYDAAGLRFEALSLQAPPARAQLDGTLSFGAPAAIAARIERFDPALFAPQWPGRIDAGVEFDGAWGPQGPSGTLQLRGLDGTLRDRALRGEARIVLRAGGWTEGTATLSSGAARIDAQARDAGAWWELRAEAADLADLWPGAGGSLAATWRRDAGDRVELRARDIEVGGIRAARLDAAARLGPGRDGAVAARIEAGGVSARGQSIGRLRIEAEGTLADHVAVLGVDDAARDGTARFTGGWRDDAWSGALETLEARAAGASLRLREPAALELAGTRARLAPACFDTTGGRLCVEARRDADAASAQVELEGLSLAALRAWLADPRIPALEGLASGTAMARWNADGLAEASARLESPRGLARLPKRPDLDLGYVDLALDARWDGEAGRIEGGARLVPEGRIELGADLAAVGDGIGVDATVDLRITDLSGIEAFTTTIAEPEGALRGQLRLRGGALPHSLSGAVALTGFTAQVPGQAVRLRDGVLVLAGVPGQLVLRGTVVSGDGTLTIDGRIDRDDPVPALLRVGGDRFRVANRPDLSLLASPDLTLALRNGRWQLDGSLDIPRARIDASKLESGVDRSPDVVVVDDPEPPDPARPWRARVRVSLGDDVRLEAFGFDGTLQGTLDVSQRQGAQALASGEVTLLGRYAAYGQRLDIKRGGLRWANSPLDEPTLDLRAERKVRGETVALEVRGSAASPATQVVAAPGTSDSDALALLVTGRPLNRAGADDRDRLSDASAALGAVGSQLLTRSLGGRLGLDEIGVSNDTRLDGEAFTLGKYLSPRLYVGYGIGILTRGEVFTVRYLVTDRIEIEANAGATQRAAVNWRIER
jgi:translocation and assembly module TamB